MIRTVYVQVHVVFKIRYLVLSYANSFSNHKSDLSHQNLSNVAPIKIRPLLLS